jgi:hypothetical protein
MPNDIITRSHDNALVERAGDAMRFVASTSNIDRYNSRVMQDWDDKAFLANPIFLWMHDANRPAVGRVATWEPEESRTIAGVEFAPTPFGQEVQALYAGGYQKAVSVSFIPGAVEYVGDVLIYAQNEMLELSAVTIPGNAEALKLARAKGLIENLDAYSRHVAGLTKEEAELHVLGATLQEIRDVMASFENQQRRIDALENLLLARSSEVQPAVLKYRITESKND